MILNSKVEFKNEI
jgi:hypothetical protein